MGSPRLDLGDCGAGPHDRAAYERFVRDLGSGSWLFVEDAALGTVSGTLEYCDEQGYAIGGRYLLWANIERASGSHV